MFEKLKKIVVFGLVTTSLFAATRDLHAYTKKAPYSDYGKISKTTGLPKTKIVSGHVKRTSKGYTYVNPYAKSK